MRELVASLFFLLACALSTPTPDGATSAASTTATLDEAERRKPFALELPELGVPPITAPEAVIPTAGLRKLRLHVKQPFADSINYGKIYTRINGESAGTIQNINAGSDGYIVTCDLERKPRFRLQQGKNVIEINAVDKTGRSYYASYVLLAGGGKAEGASAASGATVEMFPLTAGGDLDPPAIYLTQPKGALRLTGDTATFKVSGVVTDNSGAVASVNINNEAATLSPPTGARGLALSGGETTMATAAAAEPGAVAFERTVVISAVASSLIVEAKDKAGNLTRLTIPARRRAAAVSAQFKGRKFALIVGVSRYKYHDGGLSNLVYADADARAVRDFLQRREGGGFAPADISYLENEQATIEGMRAALTRFLPKAGPGDLIFIFIAGHGGPDPYAPQNLYFMLHDTKLADMPNTALPMTELQEALDHSVRAERLVVLVDTCHSAGLSGEKLVTTRGVENNLINLYTAKLFNETGRAVLTSSDVNEVSRESPRWGGGHGIFTWALLEGLRGGADANSDRFVTAGELFSFVHDRVSIETAFRQNPRALPGLNADLELAFVRPE